MSLEYIECFGQAVESTGLAAGVYEAAIRKALDERL
jgi:hypothetical protein